MVDESHPPHRPRTSSSGLWPRPKSEEIEAMLSIITGKDRPTCVLLGECTMCEAYDITRASFRDVQSRDEYEISGLCQACQDEAFAEQEG